MIGRRRRARAPAARQQRIGAVVLGLAVAIVGAVIVMNSETGSSGSHPKRRLPSVAGFRGVVVLVETSDFLRADYGTGTARTARPPTGTFVHYPTDLVRRHGGFVFATDGQAFAARLRLEEPLTRLGPALDVLPAASADRVWIVDPSRTTAREVDMHGRPIGLSRPVPLDGIPVTGVVAGAGTGPAWLVHAGSRLEVRDVETGAVRRTITTAGTLLDATATAALWRDPVGVHVTDLRTGLEQRLAPPPAGWTGYLDVGALAPGGRRAALAATAASGLTTLVVADSEGARAVGPATATTRRSGIGTWSSDGATLFFSTGDATHAFVLGSGHTVDAGLPAASALVVS